MTFEELYTGLKKVNIPLAYDHFTQPTSLPFMVFVDEGKETFVADESVWAKQTRIRLELYFKSKDPKLEEKIEKRLDEMGFLWEDEATYYIEDERMYQHNYFFVI